jgi:hypothetical protein
VIVLVEQRGRFFVIRCADRGRVTVLGGRALVPRYELTASEIALTKRSFLPDAR